MPGDGRPRFDPDEFARSAAPLNPLPTRKPRNDIQGDSPSRSEYVRHQIASRAHFLVRHLAPRFKAVDSSPVLAPVDTTLWESYRSPHPS
jgi:hypothetical protein